VTMNRRFAIPTIGLAALLALSTALQADPSQWQDHGEIRQIAEEFVQARAGAGSQVVAQAGRIDSRLRLRACGQGLEAWLPAGRQLNGGNTTIGVRCNGPVEWRLFVPVSMEVIAPVVVVREVLQRGAVIGPEHVGLEERETGALRRNFYQSLEEVMGLRLRRNLSPGTVLEPGHLEIRRLIERGQRIRLLAQGEAVSVSMAGKALENGARGQRIRVENLSSGKELEGVVTGEGTVEIRF